MRTGPPARAAAAPGSPAGATVPPVARSPPARAAARPHARIEHGIEHRGQAVGEACLGPEQPVVLDHADELAEPLVQLRDEEAVERHAGVEQPHERRLRHVGDALSAARRCRSGAARPSAAILRRTSRPTHADEAHGLASAETLAIFTRPSTTPIQASTASPLRHTSVPAGQTRVTVSASTRARSAGASELPRARRAASWRSESCGSPDADCRRDDNVRGATTLQCNRRPSADVGR